MRGEKKKEKKYESLLQMCSVLNPFILSRDFREIVSRFTGEFARNEFSENRLSFCPILYKEYSLDI